ncbi:hypothetical protein JCGZ_25511 [Jatropha curcas]|uniref:H15 domain-containing protein n=1 Tax=Jatropha curcas TaxID=180498 RepID=A0A067JX68_JATCU|nr:histone H1.2 [Jatropha curcas]KDP24595.1 hypothetical protein JCGZ_25511 [Jatropha curcas]
MDPLPPQPPFPPLPTATITAATVPVSFPTDASTLTTTASILTPATAITAEANNTTTNNNHIAHAANPTPTATQSSNHPTYTDMIYAAITALKERDGSSKRAISKYIEKAFTGLPPTHPALLTHHLKRLKSTGLLVMVKKSYKLPGARSDSTNDNSNNTSVPTQSQPPPHPAVSASPLSGPKRGRGRPPKPKSNSQPLGSVQPNQQPNSNGTVNANSNTNSQPIMVPVGLSFTTHSNVAPTTNFVPIPTTTNPANVAASAPPAAAPAVAQQQQVAMAKRGPGRPKKVVGQSVGGGGAPVGVIGKRRGRPPKSISIGAKKSPGRPKKPKSVAANGVKKGPKRLPKSVVVPYATGTAAVLNVPRPRGRPKKGGVLTAPAGGVVVPARRPGRPPKVGGIVNPKKRPGRPAGRPRKENVKVSWALSEASQPQAEAYGDLKRKFEFFQSKVKQAVGVLKPQLTSETAAGAVAAIQELEGLASMDINTPLREEPQAQLPLIQN